MLSYDEALDYVYSFVDYSRTHASQFSAAALDLGRMVACMLALGDPHTRYPTVHVAGTKGKGSVSALCASALRAAGYRVGLYISPHLQDFCERAQINGELIPRAVVAETITRFKALVEQNTAPGITTFELTTALAFDYFARENVDIAVIEVGLGGRLDATNILTPLVSVITSLSYDHTAILGNTLAEIAGEKGGIIKPGVPVVTAPQASEALEVLERLADERHAPLTVIGRDWHYQPGGHTLTEQTFTIAPAPTPEASATLALPLLGAHQIENGAVAYATLQVVRERGWQKITPEVIQAGFANVRWPGRFEILEHAPLLIADGAHNRDSARKLVATVREYFPGRPVTLIFGAAADKDVSGMLEELLPLAAHAVFTQAAHPRAQTPAALFALAREASGVIFTQPTVARALTWALQLTPDRGVIVACGSLFVAAEVQTAWRVQRAWQTRPRLLDVYPSRDD